MRDERHQGRCKVLRGKSKLSFHVSRVTFQVLVRPPARRGWIFAIKGSTPDRTTLRGAWKEKEPDADGDHDQERKTINHGDCVVRVTVLWSMGP